MLQDQKHMWHILIVKLVCPSSRNSFNSFRYRGSFDAYVLDWGVYEVVGWEIGILEALYSVLLSLNTGMHSSSWICVIGKCASNKLGTWFDKAVKGKTFSWNLTSLEVMTLWVSKV